MLTREMRKMWAAREIVDKGHGMRHKREVKGGDGSLDEGLGGGGPHIY